MLPQSEFPPAIGAGEFFFFIVYSFMVYHCSFINKPLVAMGTGEIFFTSMMFLMVTQSALTGEHFPTIGAGEFFFNMHPYFMPRQLIRPFVCLITVRAAVWPFG